MVSVVNVLDRVPEAVAVLRTARAALRPAGRLPWGATLGAEAEGLPEGGP